MTDIEKRAALRMYLDGKKSVEIAAVLKVQLHQVQGFISYLKSVHGFMKFL